MTATDSATVRAYGSATVTAYDSATVRAYGSATVTATDSATVRAYGSATVTATDSATVTAYDSATVTATDSATVTAYDSATVTAAKYVAIHLHSQRVTLDGCGHVIDLTSIDLNDPPQWCDYRGVNVIDGIAYLFKAVGDDWKSDYGTSYQPGTTPDAPDWSVTRTCGQGLHFCAHPFESLTYKPDATRFVKCGVRLDEMVTLDDKVKAKRVVVPCVEVDIDGNEVPA
ncbi:DUF7666 domain-containing protein [Mycobacterium sp. ML1]